MTTTLAVGLRFRPTDEELIIYYLLRKVRGEELLWDGIPECDLYGEKTPWEICDDLCDQEGKFYVFTNLKKLRRNRVARSAGCGTWQENNGVEKIYDNQGMHVIGLKKPFCFKIKEGLCRERSNWIMHEFSLAGISLLGKQERSSNLVLCVLQKVKRCSENQSYIVEIPGTITSVETSCDETPQALNTNVLLLQEGTQQRKDAFQRRI